MINKKLIAEGSDMIIACTNGNLTKLISLVNKGENINQTDNNGKTPLHVASYWEHQEITKYLLTCGADTSKQDHNGDTPMHLAAYWGNKSIIESLIQKKSSLTIKNRRGETPIDLARSQDNNEIVKYLEKILLEQATDNVKQKKINKNRL